MVGLDWQISGAARMVDAAGAEACLPPLLPSLSASAQLACPAHFPPSTHPSRPPIVLQVQHISELEQDGSTYLVGAALDADAMQNSLPTKLTATTAATAVLQACGTQERQLMLELGSKGMLDPTMAAGLSRLAAAKACDEGGDLDAAIRHLTARDALTATATTADGGPALPNRTDRNGEAFATLDRSRLYLSRLLFQTRRVEEALQVLIHEANPGNSGAGAGNRAPAAAGVSKPQQPQQEASANPPKLSLGDILELSTPRGEEGSAAPGGLFYEFDFGEVPWLGSSWEVRH